MPNISQTATLLPLVNASLAYSNDSDMFIHNLISPAVPVIKDSATIYSYGAENMRITNTIRAKGAKGNVIDWSVSKATHYNLEDHVQGAYIAIEDYENAEKPIEPRMDTVEILTETLMVAKEYALASAMQATATMTNNTTLTGTDQWNDYTNSDPIDDILTGINAVKTASGKLPNTLIIAWDAYLKLLYHPTIKDMFPAATSITFDMLSSGLAAKFPMIKKVHVGMAQYNNSNAGGALNLDEIWTKTCIVAYIEDRPKLKSRSLSYTYQYKTPRSVDFVSMDSGSVELKQRKSDYIQVSDKYDQVLVDVNCGYLIKSCIA